MKDILKKIKPFQYYFFGNSKNVSNFATNNAELSIYKR